MVIEIAILAALLAWSFLGMRHVLRHRGNGTMRLRDAVLLGPVVLFLWLLLWVSKVGVEINRRDV